MAQEENGVAYSFDLGVREAEIGDVADNVVRG